MVIKFNNLVVSIIAILSAVTCSIADQVLLYTKLGRTSSSQSIAVTTSANHTISGHEQSGEVLESTCPTWYYCTRDGSCSCGDVVSQGRQHHRDISSANVLLDQQHLEGKSILRLSQPYPESRLMEVICCWGMAPFLRVARRLWASALSGLSSSHEWWLR